MANTSYGARMLIASQLTRIALTAIGMVTLSRLLTPYMFGQAAVATAVVNIATTLGDLGLSNAAIRESSLDKKQWSGLFWVNLAIGIFLAVAVLAFTPLLVRGNPDADLVRRLLWLAVVVFICNGFSAQFQVELIRTGRFTALAIIETTGALIGLLSALSIAWFAPSAWALIWKLAVGPLVIALLLPFVVRNRPLRPQRNSGVRNIVALGSTTTASRVLNTLSLNLGPMAMSGNVSSALVGAYTSGLTIADLPTQALVGPLTRVLLKPLSDSIGSPTLLKMYARVTAAYAYSVGLVTVLIAGFAPQVVAIALGSQWVEIAPPVVTLLAVAYLLYLIWITIHWLLLAGGHAKVILYCDIPGKVISIIGIIIFGNRGPVAVAWALIIGFAVTSLLNVVWGTRTVGIKPISALQQLVPVFVVLGGIFAIGKALQGLLAGQNPLLVLGVGLLASGLYVLLACAVAPPIRNQFRYAVEIVSEVTGINLGKRLNRNSA